MPELSISYDDVEQAQRRIAAHAHITPVMRSNTADERTGARLYFKCEHLQRAGAFKFRGAFNALSRFSPAQKSRGVVTYSSGNHAQAIALASRMLGIAAVIVMPHDAPSVKVDATRGYGAEIIFYDRYTQDRESIGQSLVDARGLTLIPPYDHPHVMAGQGTAAIELFDQAGALDVLLVPLGGGGLAFWLRYRCKGASSHLQSYRRRARRWQRWPAEFSSRQHRTHPDTCHHR